MLMVSLEWFYFGLLPLKHVGPASNAWDGFSSCTLAPVVRACGFFLYGYSFEHGNGFRYGCVGVAGYGLVGITQQEKKQHS